MVVFYLHPHTPEVQSAHTVSLRLLTDLLGYDVLCCAMCCVVTCNRSWQAEAEEGDQEEATGVLTPVDSLGLLIES